MFAARIVEAIDVLEDCGFSLSACLPSSPPDQLGLDGFEEGLDGCVIIAIAFAAHRRLEAVFAQDLLVVVRTILTAPVAVAVAVEDAALGRLPQGNGHP